MAIAPHLKRIRRMVGHELLVLPSVSVLPGDDQGRILLVRIIDTGEWATIGGSIEPDESPEQTAVREAQEEAGVTVALGRLLGVFGGPEFRITYPNGDQVSYVTTVFDATVVAGTPGPDGDETSEARWWPAEALPTNEMSTFTRALLRGLDLDTAAGTG